MKKSIIPVLFMLLIFTSCETEKQKNDRLEQEYLIELRQKEIDEALEKENAIKLEEERVEAEAILKKEREEKEIYDRYIDNSLKTGATPYAYCFGENFSCSDYGCSEIKVKTPYNSDVLVTIKKGDKIYRHAFIKAGENYTFQFPNGIYQTFFYYGKGWNPTKFMKNTSCGDLRGGFIADELFSKDNPQTLSNSILEYELILQQNGNFSTKPSNLEELF